jgi:Asp-tRNA(Asn)/Glu-tRNA(Gln) amidotransferase A subunit family amidase
MARDVTDLARLLDCMVGYDPNDPITARGAGRAPDSFTDALDMDALSGARIGILREIMGFRTDADSDDFNKVTEVFENSINELREAGAEIIDNIIIPELADLLAKRADDSKQVSESFRVYMAGCANTPFATREEVIASPLFAKTSIGVRRRWGYKNSKEEHHNYLKARELLMTRFLAVMTDHNLDAVVHKAVEHTATLIKDGINPPKGAPHINTFLIYVPSVVVPAGFTSNDKPTGITFLGRPYDDSNMLNMAYAYEQVTNHRRIPDNKWL